MTRKISSSRMKPWRCPICNYAAQSGSNFATQRGLAQHIAMKWDKAHEDRRVQRNLLAKYDTMEEVQEMISQILPFISNCKYNLF